MIQEILGGLVSDKNISIPYSSTCSSTQPFVTTHTSVSTTNKLNPQNSSKNGGNTATTTTTTNTNSEMSNDQNLRCPRCDSTNTKFCYYNNYNLTQPRHFCKACRRYWTKGGTLRNVPIGGGCRKNKSTFQSYSSTSNNNAMFKAKTNLSCDVLANENSLFLGSGLLDHPLRLPGPSPILWSSLPQPQNSHILSLLGGSNPNPSPCPPPNVFTSLGLDSYGNGNGAPSQLGSFPTNNQLQLNGFAPEFVDNNNDSNSNILDLYQRSKSSSLSSNYGYRNGNDNPGSVILGHMIGSTLTSSTVNSSILDATPLGVGDHLGGYDFPLVPINGSYP